MKRDRSRPSRSAALNTGSTLSRALLALGAVAWFIGFALLLTGAGPWTDDYGFTLRGFQTDSVWPESSPWAVWAYYWRPVFLAVAYYGATFLWDHWWVLALLTALCHTLVAHRVWRLARVIGLNELASGAAALITLVYPLAFESPFWWAGIGTPGAVAVGVYVVERAWRFATPQRVRLIELIWVFLWASLLVNINEQPVSLFAGACGAALVGGWISRRDSPRAAFHALGRAAWVALSCGTACVVYVSLLVATSPPGKRGASGGYVSLDQLPTRIHAIARQAYEKLLGHTAQEFIAGAFLHGVRTLADQGVLIAGVCAIGLLVSAVWVVRAAVRCAAAGSHSDEHGARASFGLASSVRSEDSEAAGLDVRSRGSSESSSATPGQGENSDRPRSGRPADTDRRHESRAALQAAGEFTHATEGVVAESPPPSATKVQACGLQDDPSCTSEDTGSVDPALPSGAMPASGPRLPRITPLLAAAVISALVLLCAFVPNILVVTNNLSSRYFLVIGVVLGLWIAIVVQAITGTSPTPTVAPVDTREPRVRARHATSAAMVAAIVATLTILGTISMLGFQQVFRERFAQESRQVQALRDAVPHAPQGTFYICLRDDSRTASTGYATFDRSPSHSIRFPWSARSYIRRGVDRADAEALPMIRPGVRASLARWPIDGVTAEVIPDSPTPSPAATRDGLVVTRPAGRPARIIPLDRCVPYVLQPDGSIALVRQLTAPVVPAPAGGHSSASRTVTFPLVSTIGAQDWPRIDFSMIDPASPTDTAPSTLSP